MDSALKLKIDLDNSIKFSEQEIKNILNQSEIVKEVTTGFIDKPLFYVWRLIALSEIPYSITLSYTQNLIEKIYDKLAFPYGFSLSGDEKMFLPCYNAMLATALCRLGKAEDEQVKKAINWINKYQPMERNIEVDLPDLKFDRYGGCFHNTPCYIGLAKSMIALNEYYKSTKDNSVKEKLEHGLEYILKHHLYKRLSNGKPITHHILDISFPESYHLNIVELIRLVSETNILNDERTKDAINYLLSKKTENGWKITYRYKAEGYMVFDKGRGSGDWVSYIINKALNSTTI